MAPERWQEVKKVLAGALERKPEQRRVYLDQACTDPDLRREVETLIAAHEQGDSSFMEQPAAYGGPLPSGTKLGPYTILAPIGAGGMGEVYRAQDSKLKRDVAIKVLPLAFVNDSERLARFQREARLLASLNHPSIATIYGLEDSDSTHALVMELVEGPTLADRIRKGPIPVEEALPIAKQMAEALEYAHEHGIVHRDLKPANVKMTADDSVKILDFGLAKALESGPSAEDIANSPTLSQMATQAGVLLGTAAYMPPEQAKGKPVDRRADIWAFGCVLYEMLTGKKTFGAETVTDTLAAVVRAEPDWKLLPAATPMRVRVLLQRCLQRDPKLRLRDIGDARISLDEVLSGAPEAAPGVPAAIPLWRRVIPWAVASLAVLALVVGWLYLRIARNSGAEAAMRFHVSPPENASLADTDVFAVSPNGRQLAFLALGPDLVPRVWVRALNSLEARPLPDSEVPGRQPIFWSFDSRYILFYSEGKLKKIDVGGGPAQTLCDATAPIAGGSWNRDGVIIFGQAPGPIMKVSANGGVAAPVTALNPSRGDIDHDFPSFLPDGRHFIYRVTSKKAGESGVYIGSLDAKPKEQDPKQLLATDYAAAYVPPLGSALGQLLFVRDGTLLTQGFDASRLTLTGEPVPLAEQIGSYRSYAFFSATPNVLVYRNGGAARARLTWFDREGKALGAVGDATLYLTVSLSPNGTQAAVTRAHSLAGGNASVWLLDLSRGASTRFTFGTSFSVSPVWSPGGSHIIFGSGPSDQTSGSDIYEKSANGVQEKQLLLKSNTLDYPTSLSHDGRFLLYTTWDAKTQKAGVWVLPLKGDRQPFPFLRTAFNMFEGQFSPDGRLVAYASDESGRNEIYVRTFLPDAKAANPNSGGKWLISTNGGSEPRWRGDGKELYYVAPDGRLMAVAIATSPVFRAGVPTALFQTPARNGQLLSTDLSFWDVASDGKRFLFPAETEQSARPFIVALNWRAALKK